VDVLEGGLNTLPDFAGVPAEDKAAKTFLRHEVYLSYLPLAHIMERSVLWGT
jgi:long-subunit acyl-CoA synthetase (AMP-forming)